MAKGKNGLLDINSLDRECLDTTVRNLAVAAKDNNLEIGQLVKVSGSVGSLVSLPGVHPSLENDPSAAAEEASSSYDHWKFKSYVGMFCNDGSLIQIRGAEKGVNALEVSLMTALVELGTPLTSFTLYGRVEKHYDSNGLATHYLEVVGLDLRSQLTINDDSDIKTSDDDFPVSGVPYGVVSRKVWDKDVKGVETGCERHYTGFLLTEENVLVPFTGHDVADNPESYLTFRSASKHKEPVTIEGTRHVQEELSTIGKRLNSVSVQKLAYRNLKC